ncbi:MAG: HAMP domain-containing histidine kinase [Bacteroidetes bacterium]|nr:HAMP domain-containing histidine kinase [Bacteroidota bacterium]
MTARPTIAFATLHRLLIPCILLWLPCVAPPAYAQSPNQRSVTDRLIHLRRGYLGLTRVPQGGTLTLYNEDLANARTIVFTGLAPLDAVAMPGNALLLATGVRGTGLYRVAIDSLPTVTAIWEGPASTLNRIVGVGDYSREGGPEAVLAGDSAFAVIGLDGRERMSLHMPMLDAVVYGVTPARYVLVSRSLDAIQVAAIDARTLQTVASHQLPYAESVMARVVGTSGGDLVAVATSGPAPAAYLFDRTLAPAPDAFPLPAAPIGVLTIRSNGTSTPAAIISGYPSPIAIPLRTGAEPVTLDYPLTGTPLQAAALGDRIALAARDSIALYDGSLRLLTMLPSNGTASAHLELVGNGSVLASAPGHSALLAIPAHELRWYELHLRLLAAVTLGLAVVAITVMFIRRHRFIRTVYNNLVQNPGSAGTIILSRSQRVRHINQPARRLLHIDSLAPLGRHIMEYLSGPELGDVLSELRMLFLEGREFELRIDVPVEGHARALMFRGRTMARRYGSTAGYLLLVEDVTQTIERERLVNWASIAHHIAHEMKTPLGTVRMTAEMLHDRLSYNGGDVEGMRATNRIVRQSQRLRSIVDDLLTVARTEALQKEDADLGLVLSTLVHDVTDSLPPAIELRLEMSGNDHRCRIDAAQLSVALRNVLDNAAQAINTRENGLIRIILAEHTKGLSIIVEDNGIGMSAETLARLFQPFYTERQGGSGIGTVILKRVVEGHGGTVDVKSERGMGTRFMILLPRE